MRGVWQDWWCRTDGWMGMTDERTPREAEPPREPEGPRKAGAAGEPRRRATEAEVVEELRRSRGEGGNRPSEGEPPPPHYGRGGA